MSVVGDLVARVVELERALEMLNTQGYPGLASGETVTTKYHACAHSDDGQSIADGTTQTIIYEDEECDDNNEYNNTTGEFTASQSGHILVNATASLADTAWTAGEVCWLALYVDGTIYHVFDYHEFEDPETKPLFLGGSITYDATTNEVLTIRIYQNSGDAVALMTFDYHNRVTFDWLL